MNELTTNTTKNQCTTISMLLLKGTTLLLETHGNFDFDLKESKK